MGKINVLSFAVANLIAAGEVVDRPSSVIKELLENAIDSGADRITVEIQNGGVTYMRVADNGCGIAAEDLPVAIRRHATSKIKNAEDLDGIITLGFRGEALAAIASVSDMRIISKTKDAENGSMLVAHGGNIAGITDRAASDGTTVIVENLFSNVPARRKFLKKDVTEAMAVSAVVEKIALSKPHIAFKLIIDGNAKLETVGDGSLKNTIYSIFGRDFSSKLIETEIETDGIKIKGFIGRPDNVRANRNYQNFFINGRYVRSKTACAAIEQAYTSYIPSDKFPCCVLNIEINPSAVDVNVHPAKLEVKFSNEKPVFEAIYYSVKNSIEQNTARPNMSLSFPKPQDSYKEKGNIASTVSTSVGRVSDSVFPINDEKPISLKKAQLESELYVVSSNTKNEQTNTFSEMTAKDYLEKFVPKNDIGIKKEIQGITINKQAEEKVFKAAVSEKHEEFYTEKNRDKAEVPETSPETSFRKLTYKMVGELFNSYVIVETDEKALLIDKHAAHERILFEQLKAGMKNQVISSQMLMLPIEIMMTSDEISTLNEYKKDIESVGFEFSAGKYTVNVSSIPEGIKTEAVSDMLTVMAERLKNSTGNAKLTKDIVFEKALYQAACKAAIKAGREYADEHIKWIVDKLMEIPDITVCPHGRPVAIELSKKYLDNQFERT